MSGTDGDVWSRVDTDFELEVEDGGHLQEDVARWQEGDEQS